MAPTTNVNASNATAAEVTLTETYHDTFFLGTLVAQRSESHVLKEHWDVAKNLHKRLRGKNAFEVGYRQRMYGIGNNKSAALGRLYPKQSRFVCYQNMLGSMRRVLAGGQYVEVDMCNAQFKLLAGAFPNAQAVRLYCDERDEHLREVSEAATVPKSVAKALFIILIFGGTVDTWRAEYNVPDDAVLPEIVEQLKSDIDICKAMKAADPEYDIFIRAAKSKNHQLGKPWENTAFAIWLQDLEAKCMLEAIQFMQVEGVEAASLIHDGALIAASDRDKVDLQALGEHVRNATGLECSFAVKSLDLDEKDLEWKKAVEDGFKDPVVLRAEARSKRDPLTNLIVCAGAEGGHRLLARVFHEMFPSRFAYLGKTDGWFAFRQPRWVPMRGDTEEIVSLMDNELHKKISKVVEDLEAEDECNNFDVEAANKLLVRIAGIPFKNDLVKQLRISYKVADPSAWLSGLDSDDLLLGYEDCLYDFRSKCYHEGLPEDMVSMSVGFTCEEVQMAPASIREEILADLRCMHDSPDVFDFVLRSLATSIVGDRPSDTFLIWCGVGANGKGLTKNLAAVALGQYYYEPSAGLFATRSVSGSSLNSELAKLKGKRLAIASEAEPGDKLRAGLLKQCTGHDQIQARELYRSAIEFRCNANIVLCFNEIPGVDDSSSGISRRLRLVNHPHKFVENPSRPFERQIDRSLQAKFSSKDYGAAFLGIMIDTFNEHGFDFETPAQVISDATEYLGENDVLGQFLDKHYEETGEYGDFVKLSELWETLRDDRAVFDQLEMRHSRQLSQKLKVKGYSVKTVHGLSVLRCFKWREPDNIERCSSPSRSTSDDCTA